MQSYKKSRHNLQESKSKIIMPSDKSKEMAYHDDSIAKVNKDLLDQLENHLKLFLPSINHEIISKMKQVYEQNMVHVHQTNNISNTQLLSSSDQYYQAESMSQAKVCSSKQDNFFQNEQIDEFLSERSIESNFCEKTKRKVKYFSRKTAKKRENINIMPNFHESSHFVQAKQKTFDQIYEYNFAQNCLKRLKEWKEIAQGLNMLHCEKSSNKDNNNYWSEQQKKLKEIISLQEHGPKIDIDDVLQKSLTVRRYRKFQR